MGGLDRFGIESIFVIILYIDMKKQPNLRSHWMDSNYFFHCFVISKIMNRRPFISVNKCLHLQNLRTYVRDRNLLGYDKMGQVCEVKCLEEVSLNLHTM